MGTSNYPLMENAYPTFFPTERHLSNQGFEAHDFQVSQETIVNPFLFDCCYLTSSECHTLHTSHRDVKQIPGL